MALNLSVAPTAEPLLAQNIKDHSRISITADDNLLNSYIKAARVWLENALGSAFITQTWVLKLDNFPSSCWYMPRGPLQSITSIQYTDEDDNTSTISSSDYVVDSDSIPGRVSLKSDASWPTVTLKEINGVVITFVCGYGDAATDVPEPIKQALRLLIADMYEYRENSIVQQGLAIEQVPFGVGLWRSNYDYRDRRSLV